MPVGEPNKSLSMRAPAEGGVDDDSTPIPDVPFSLARHGAIGLLGHRLAVDPLVEGGGMAPRSPGDSLAYFVGIDRDHPQPHTQLARERRLAAAGESGHQH